jgi:hypothetical protein
MLSDASLYCHAECRYAQRRFIECRGAVAHTQKKYFLNGICLWTTKMKRVRKKICEKTLMEKNASLYFLS